MNAYVTGLTARDSSFVTTANTDQPAVSRVEAYIRAQDFARPTLVIDTEAVARQFAALAQGLGRARIHYAVKANPAPEILRKLHSLGSNFDAASRVELQMCLDAGAAPEQLSFGNTIKRASDIAWAHEQGIDLFAVDAEEEIEKIAANAPGARVYLRIIVDATEAEWPLTRKFGSGRDKALALIAMAKDYGLNPVGLSFHVGSQTRRAAMWAPILDQVAAVWHAAKAEGHELTLLNIGGGFPAFYGREIDAPALYAAEVMRLVQERFGDVPEIMAEPGRGLVAEAAMIAADKASLAAPAVT